MTEAILLNKSFDITEDLIKKNPEKENNIINDYNDYIIKIKSNLQINKSYVRSATFKDDNEFDNQNGIIKIHNNFQKYNNESLLNPLSSTETTTEKFENKFDDYFKSMTGGFKDYLKL
jgi:hypothetical protein